jgi:hypothetical protein
MRRVQDEHEDLLAVGPVLQELGVVSQDRQPPDQGVSVIGDMDMAQGTCDSGWVEIMRDSVRSMAQAAAIPTGIISTGTVARRRRSSFGTLKAMLAIMEGMSALSPIGGGLRGLPVYESPLLDELDLREPVRKHKKRSNQSEAYHRRVQKKWAKRWGMQDVGLMFMGMDVGDPRGDQSVIFMSPSVMAELKGDTRCLVI